MGRIREQEYSIESEIRCKRAKLNLLAYYRDRRLTSEK